jgi:hypothetical protein
LERREMTPGNKDLFSVASELSANFHLYPMA